MKCIRLVEKNRIRRGKLSGKKENSPIAIPKKKAITTKLVNEAQKGVNPTDIVQITRQQLLRNNASTDGRSAK